MAWCAPPPPPPPAAAAALLPPPLLRLRIWLRAAYPVQMLAHPSLSGLRAQDDIAGRASPPGAEDLSPRGLARQRELEEELMLFFRTNA